MTNKINDVTLVVFILLINVARTEF